jgi:hypothetical protein
LSEVSRAGLTEREAEAAERVGQRNWLYMLIFDMADGLTPHLDRPLDEALRECASREDSTASALVRRHSTRRIEHAGQRRLTLHPGALRGVSSE